MTSRAIATIILAAGHGTRMKSQTPKVLHAIAGRSLLDHVIASARALSPDRMAVVIGDHAPQIGEAAKAAFGDMSVHVQAPPRGTGDAVRQAIPSLQDFDGVVLIAYADTPLVTSQTLRALSEQITNGAAVAVLGFRPFDPGAYGRLQCSADGALQAIIEAKDASPEELDNDFCNSGVMAVEAKFLLRALPQLKDDNAKKEFYLTDIVALARGENLSCAVIEADEDEVIGVNSRTELAIAEEIYQNTRRLQAMEDGVTLIDPSSVYFSFDTALAQDVVIEPNVFFGPGVEIERGARIKGFSHIEGAKIGAGAHIGPFARLRPGADLGPDVRVGNFVEIKKTEIGAGAKINHLTYVGDASIGAGANLGAGTITCNYDGFSKHKTEIGAGAFVGSNSALVAPVKIGDGAYVGSGSVITKDVDPDALAVGRARQSSIKDWAAKFRKVHGQNNRGQNNRGQNNRGRKNGGEKSG